MNEQDYITREIMAYTKERALRARAPLADRKEAQAQYMHSLQNELDALAERVSWLLDGSYGRGPSEIARRILASPRMNQPAAISILVADCEWLCPERHARAAWNKLSARQQQAVTETIRKAIK